MRRKVTVCLALLLSLLVLSACTTHQTTTTVTTKTVECDVPEDGSESDIRECTTIDEETTVSHRPRQCHGILSCGFYVAGEAIALPFRALGAVLSIVF